MNAVLKVCEAQVDSNKPYASTTQYAEKSLLARKHEMIHRG